MFLGMCFGWSSKCKIIKEWFSLLIENFNKKLSEIFVIVFISMRVFIWVLVSWIWLFFVFIWLRRIWIMLYFFIGMGFLVFCF